MEYSVLKPFFIVFASEFIKIEVSLRIYVCSTWQVQFSLHDKSACLFVKYLNSMIAFGQRLSRSVKECLPIGETRIRLHSSAKKQE